MNRCQRILICLKVIFDFIKEKFRNKNYNEIENISKKLESISRKLLSLVGQADLNIKKLRKIKFPKYTQIEINNFVKIVDKIIKSFQL